MPNDKFYTSKAWRNLRALQLSENPFCKKCNEIATEVDHIISRKLRPDLELVKENLQSLCKSCHSSKTHSEKKKTWQMYNAKYI